jgi:excisionase family DNA binding protein
MEPARGSVECGGTVVIRPPEKVAKREEEEGGARRRLDEQRALLAPAVAGLAAEEKRELVTVMAAARLLGKSRDTIYRWLDGGRLAGRRVGGRWLVYKDAVEKEWSAGVVGQEKD